MPFCRASPTVWSLLIPGELDEGVGDAEYSSAIGLLASCLLWLWERGLAVEVGDFLLLRLPACG